MEPNTHSENSFMDPARADDRLLSMLKDGFRDAAREGKPASVTTQNNSPEAEAKFKQDVTEFLSSEGFSAAQIAKVFPE